MSQSKLLEQAPINPKEQNLSGTTEAGFGFQDTIHSLRLQTSELFNLAPNILRALEAIQKLSSLANKGKEILPQFNSISKAI